MRKTTITISPSTTIGLLILKGNTLALFPRSRFSDRIDPVGLKRWPDGAWTLSFGIAAVEFHPCPPNKPNPKSK